MRFFRKFWWKWFHKKHTTGMEDPTVDNTLKIEYVATGATAESVDLRPNMNWISNQGMYNSCVAEATCKLLEYDLTYNKQFGGWPNLDVSPAFLWFFARMNEGNQNYNCGVNASTIFDVVKKVGFVIREVWDYSDGITTYPNNNAVIEGQLFELYLGQLPMFCSIKSSSDAKNALSNNHPVVFAFPVSAEFDTFLGDVYTGPLDAEHGTHAMIICGFDNNGFIVANSWGTGWGRQGFFHLPFDTFDKVAFSAWTLQTS